MRTAAVRERASRSRYAWSAGRTAKGGIVRGWGSRITSHEDSSHPTSWLSMFHPLGIELLGDIPVQRLPGAPSAERMQVPRATLDRHWAQRPGAPCTCNLARCPFCRRVARAPSCRAWGLRPPIGPSARGTRLAAQPPESVACGGCEDFGRGPGGQRALGRFSAGTRAASNLLRGRGGRTARGGDGRRQVACLLDPGRRAGPGCALRLPGDRPAHELYLGSPSMARSGGHSHLCAARSPARFRASE